MSLMEPSRLLHPLALVNSRETPLKAKMFTTVLTDEAASLLSDHP